ncbi:16S rRNA (cytidine(1402)-2'-O)-methyltransferase [Pueribacillus theae]|uniref:Ribosomal RNA small subunit methyltransferase I n=1 Tax=Pueribacillus theae TaxID=2171751 RepID=A0A2U1K4N1_9BACI|nr:16S rRNA (cytidine(1402)-2'-O)-methyltransferase [Pueribacillus theae]PWA12109.1 16S rRNA (cytidine(1402)-2'-O)-methyltransferase [Pueribacillus theae]
MSQKQMDEASGSKGCLYLVPTPIGNLEDITFRAVSTLKEVDVIAAEDTRVTRKLCNHYEIGTPLISYHEHNKERQGAHLIEQLIKGKKIALVTDAGTPAISDPGNDLVTACIGEGIQVIPLPGANAAITALIASGLLTNHFYFYGFLPRSHKEKKQALQDLVYMKVPIIFYEAPHRLKETLKEIHQAFGDRNAVIARELTKRYEEFIRGTVQDLTNWAENAAIRGEFCIIVEGASDDQPSETNHWWSHLSVKEHVTYYIEKEGQPTKEAVKQAAKDRGLPKREVYHIYHIDS